RRGLVARFHIYSGRQLLVLSPWRLELRESNITRPPPNPHIHDGKNSSGPFCIYRFADKSHRLRGRSNSHGYRVGMHSLAFRTHHALCRIPGFYRDDEVVLGRNRRSDWLQSRVAGRLRNRLLWRPSPSRALWPMDSPIAPRTGLGRSLLSPLGISGG